ncbi:40553_t:CDS:2, partial [Gigaspora margarita]
MPTLPTSRDVKRSPSLTITAAHDHWNSVLKGSSSLESTQKKNLHISDRIDASILHDLLNETNNPPNILVLDIRLRSVFEMGHIKTKNTVCLEPFLLEDRISSVTLESNLRTYPEHEQKLFAERHNFDLVVYYGHDSGIMHKNSVTNLVQAIFENDYVFLVGGEQLTGEGGVEHNIYNNNTQINQYSTLFNDLTNNMSSKPKVTAPNRPLPRPIPNVSNNSDNSSINQSGSRLQRRKAIFDFPYHGFSE